MPGREVGGAVNFHARLAVVAFCAVAIALAALVIFVKLNWIDLR